MNNTKTTPREMFFEAYSVGSPLTINGVVVGRIAEVKHHGRLGDMMLFGRETVELIIQMDRPIIEPRSITPPDDEDGWFVEPADVKAARKLRELEIQGILGGQMVNGVLKEGLSEKDYHYELVVGGGGAASESDEDFPVQEPEPYPDYETCMCGDPMKNHESAMSCGHMPVSVAAHYAKQDAEEEDGYVLYKPSQTMAEALSSPEEDFPENPQTEPEAKLDVSVDMNVENMMHALDAVRYAAFGVPESHLYNAKSIQTGASLTMEVLEKAAKLGGEDFGRIPQDIVSMDQWKTRLHADTNKVFQRLILGEFVSPKERSDADRKYNKEKEKEMHPPMMGLDAQLRAEKEKADDARLIQVTSRHEGKWSSREEVAVVSKHVNYIAHERIDMEAFRGMPDFAIDTTTREKCPSCSSNGAFFSYHGKDLVGIFCKACGHASDEKD